MTWERVKLSDVADIVAGQSPPSSTYNTEGIGLPFYQGKADFGERFPNTRQWCSAPVKIAEAGDVLISVRAPVGPTNLSAEKCCIGRGLSAVRPSDAIDTNYLLHCLSFVSPALVKIARGSTFEAITQKDLKDLEIPLPPLPVQRRIAAVLDEVDALRQKREQSIELIDKAISAALPNTSVEGQSYKLRDVSLKITDGTHQSPEWADVGIPFIFISSVTKWDIDFNSGKYVTEREYEKFIQRIPLEVGDIIYTTVGATYGTACLITEPQPMCFQRHIAYIKPNQEIVRSEYLIGVLQSPEYYHWATSKVRGAAQPTLNLSDLKESIIFIPSLELQKKYIEKRNELIQLRTKALNQLQKLNEIRSSLQARAFAGELEFGAWELSAQDAQTFIEALINPASPNDALRKAAQRSKERLG